jgi:hypothetical protein
MTPSWQRKTEQRKRLVQVVAVRREKESKGREGETGGGRVAFVM